jgi:hypothetical protein
VDAGVESLKAADEVIAGLAPSLGDLELSTFSMKKVPQILDAIADANPAFLSAEVHISAADAALKQIKGPLSPQVEKWVSKANSLVMFAQYGIKGAPIVPGLLGQTGSRTYLVLLQNSDELRPTGGFISAVGRVQISKGQLVSITADDSYAIDDFSKIYPDPPQPLLEYMGSEQWVLRDANWSPDFPTTALDAIQLYQISRTEQIDGVIGLNLRGVGMLISGVEPLDVKGLAEPVTSTNVIKILQEGWNPPENFDQKDVDWWSWYLNRKKTINLIMQSTMEKLLAGEVNWKQLGQGIVDALNQRQLMIFTIPEANELEKLTWNGSLRQNTGDYLMVVDANVGFNKVNPLIRESAIYSVGLLPDGTGHAAVELNYENQSNPSDSICSQVISYHRNVDYANMMQACYYDYLRLIVPHGSQLLEASAHPVPGKYLVSGRPADGKAVLLHEGLNNWTIFGQFFVVEYGKELQTRLEYDLPVVVTDRLRQKRYTLYLQKQPGTDAMEVVVKLALPAQARLVSSSPPPKTHYGSTLEYDFHLNMDQQLEVVYAPGP